MTIASAEALTRTLSNDEKKQDKERFRCKGKLRKLEVNNNQLLIETRKQMQEVVTLKNAVEKVKQNMSNNEGTMCEHFKIKGSEKIV